MEKQLVSSLEIAKTFSIEHHNVLNAIFNLKCTRKFNSENIILKIWHDDIHGIDLPDYLLTPDAFGAVCLKLSQMNRGKEFRIRKYEKLISKKYISLEVA